MVYSASSARDLLSHAGDGSGYLVRYLVYAAAGLALMQVLSRRGLDAVRNAAPTLLAVSFVARLVVMLPGIGVQINGARRWIDAGPLQFQPSELMKLALLLYAVGLITRPRRPPRSLRAVTPLLIVAALACLLVALQPDLGTALVMALTLIALLVAAGMPWRQLALLAAAGVALVALFALLEPYRRARLTSFLNPWGHAGGSGFQSVQAQIALGSGGLFGVGLGRSVQKVFYLPEAHTDFILAVIGEEFGFAGVLTVLALYGSLAYAGLRVARNAACRYGQLLAAGITAMILCQATLNVFAVLGLAPLTGVPLPFISYGSNNLVMLLAGMGLLLNVASGGRASVRAVRDPRPRAGKARTDADRDRRGRDRRARRAGARGGQRAAR
jgi:cell division protein FtsW